MYCGIIIVCISQHPHESRMVSISTTTVGLVNLFVKWSVGGCSCPPSLVWFHFVLLSGSSGNFLVGADL